jgi:hypothetical protein
MNESFSRDERGLLKGVEYLFKPDGGVDWRAMLKPEHLVFNRQMKDDIEAKYGKSLSSLAVTDVEDKYLLILLSGIRYLARLRGMISAQPVVGASQPGHASVAMTIKWVANFETSGVEESYGDVGVANYNNTFDFAQLYLDSIANNRAFVRAVRNYLGINIVANDEVGPSKKINFVEPVSQSTGSAPSDLLDKKIAGLKLDFTKFRDGVVKKYSGLKFESKPAEWTSSKDIPANDIYILLDLMTGK